MSTRRGDTRDRILESALHLFAEYGYREVSVGEIEEAVGLAPRRGGFYRHFRSKEDVLEACVEHHAKRLAGMYAEIPDAVDLPPRDRLRALATWALAFLREQRPLLRVLARDGERLPRLLRRVHRRLVAPGYELAEREFSRLRKSGGRRAARGAAAVALGAIVHYVEDEDTYGIPPAGAKEREFIDAWVEMVAAWGSAEPARRTRRSR